MSPEGALEVRPPRRLRAVVARALPVVGGPAEEEERAGGERYDAECEHRLVDVRRKRVHDAQCNRERQRKRDEQRADAPRGRRAAARRPNCGGTDRDEEQRSDRYVDDKQDLSVSRQLAGTHGPRRANPTFGWSHAGPDPLPDERRPTSSRSGGQRSPASTENGLMNGSLIGERGCDEAGQTFVEYAVLLVAIAGLVVAGWASIDGAITTAIGNVISAF
jgi:Flp pilus assembly pilin Flp